MEQLEFEQLCDQLIEVSQRAFELQVYEAAYHTLHAAVHCAFVLSDEARLETLEKMSREQSAWIDSHDPSSILATPSPSKPSGSNLYGALIRQASARLQIVRSQC